MSAEDTNKRNACRRDDGPALRAVEGLVLCDHVPGRGFEPRVFVRRQHHRGPWSGGLHEASRREARPVHQDEGVDHRYVAIESSFWELRLVLDDCSG